MGAKTSTSSCGRSKIGLPMSEVLEILEALDVNSRRIECRFDPGGRQGRLPDNGSNRVRRHDASSELLLAGLTGPPLPDTRPGSGRSSRSRPTSRVGLSESDQLGPAISRWTQGVDADELLEELGGRDRPAPFAADVFQVGDVALELLLVIVVERQPPDALAGLPAGGDDVLGERRRRC